jgi:hypothetical protein
VIKVRRFVVIGQELYWFGPSTRADGMHFGTSDGLTRSNFFGIVRRCISDRQYKRQSQQRHSQPDSKPLQWPELFGIGVVSRFVVVK